MTTSIPVQELLAQLLFAIAVLSVLFLSSGTGRVCAQTAYYRVKTRYYQLLRAFYEASTARAKASTERANRLAKKAEALTTRLSSLKQERQDTPLDSMTKEEKREHFRRYADIYLWLFLTKAATAALKLGATIAAGLLAVYVYRWAVTPQ